jgi:hypothetical protein
VNHLAINWLIIAYKNANLPMVRPPIITAFYSQEFGGFYKCTSLTTQAQNLPLFCNPRKIT